LRLLQWLSQQAHNYDLAHIHALFSPVSSTAAWVARRQQLPYILRPLGTLDPADLQKKRQLKQLYAQVLERPNLTGAAALHFTSDQEAKISERFGTINHDWVIPLGVTLPEPSTGDIKAKLGIPSHTPTVLFLSRFDRKKGLDLLIPALERLPECHFILAGGNPQDSAYETEIRQRIAQSNLRDRTTVTGFITGSDKTALLQAADLFVLPSYYENFGIAVAEAMMAGTPVVISDQVHIWQEIHQSESGWITTCDEEDLTQTLRLALSDRAEMTRRGNNAQHHAKTNYGWDAIASQLITAYASVLTLDS
jgi:glycosyltransferase involved in cell wall biosynthesis